MKKNNLMKITITTIITLGMLSGCSNKSNGLVTGQEDIGATSDGSSSSRLEAVATGTAVGAGIGAVVGKQFKSTKFGAYVGGMIGAVTGDIVHKTSKAAAANEHAYAEAEKTNNQNSDRLNKKSDEMENAMGSSIQ
jgi:F0F1-type ATP synthase assembly protein I